MVDVDAEIVDHVNSATKEKNKKQKRKCMFFLIISGIFFEHCGNLV